MDRFIKELEIGDIHQRDLWQFELKSEFIPQLHLRTNTYTQELYLFIPNSLQVNEESYPIDNFYQDATNFIRYKTPVFELESLLDKKNESSPFTRLSKLLDSKGDKKELAHIEDELKLLANIVRSALRNRIGCLIEKIQTRREGVASIAEDMQELCKALEQLHIAYDAIQAGFMNKDLSLMLRSHFLYIDEFLSITISYYLLGFMDYLDQFNLSNSSEIKEMLFPQLLEEKNRCEIKLKRGRLSPEDTVNNEYILYRSNLLNKFVVDALLLHTTRASVVKRFNNLIGSIAAGVAMFFFFLLSQQSHVIINSVPFLILSILLYVLKDRIKEGLKNLSYRQFAKWFADFKTTIYTPDGDKKLGVMEEYASFIHEEKIPKEITTIRNREFHKVLETYQRPERVLYYKKVIRLSRSRHPLNARRNALNIIFRFTINKFLLKADDPVHDYIELNTDNLEFFHTIIPKVYHLNMILKNTYYDKEGVKQVELKKFRLVLDKNGIKRLEHITTKIEKTTPKK